MIKAILTAVATSLLSSAAFAETTVSEISHDGFPYDMRISFILRGDDLFLKCRDQYLDSGYLKVDYDGVIASLEKALEWSNINRNVKANIDKKAGHSISFRGLESGSSIISAVPGSKICIATPGRISSLLSGLEADLEKAKTLESRDLDQIFQ